MTGAKDLLLEITPQVLLKAYACGIFPMAESTDDPGIFWVEPELRGILPLDEFHIPRSLAKRVRQKPFDIRIDTRFEEVVEACAQPTADRPSTWINPRIKRLYLELHEAGHCHSVECWRDGELVALAGAGGVQRGGLREIDALGRLRDLLLALFFRPGFTGGFGAGFTRFRPAYPWEPLGKDIVNGAVLKLEAAFLDLDRLIFVKGEIIGYLLW